MLPERAPSEGPRSTAAVEDQSGPLPGRKRASLEGEWRGGWHGLCARRAPTVRQWSLDTRSGDHTSRLLNEEAGKELSVAPVWPVSLVMAHGCAHDIEVRPSSPTADEFHPNAKKKECPGFVSAAKSFTRTRVICHSDSHRCSPNLIENPHQLIHLHRGKESVWTLRCKVGERRLVER